MMDGGGQLVGVGCSWVLDGGWWLVGCQVVRVNGRGHQYMVGVTSTW